MSNNKINKVKVNKVEYDVEDVFGRSIAEKAASDIGTDEITILQGNIGEDGTENSSSFYLRTKKISNYFKLEVNDGYKIGFLAQYDLSGTYLATYTYGRNLDKIDWTPTKIIVTDKEYLWSVIIYKGDIPNVSIVTPEEDVVKSFLTGIYYFIQGGEDDPDSIAKQTKESVDTTIGPLVSRISKIEQEVFPLEVSLTVSPSGAQEFTGANRDFTISWTVKIAGEQVVPSKLELKVGTDYVPVDIGDVSKVVSANNDKQVTLLVEAEGRSATKTVNINFARRYYSAVVDSAWTATNDTIKALAKSALKSSAAATVSYSAATQKKIVFAYPVSHDIMSTIKDAYGNSMFTLNDSGKTFNTAPKTVAVTLSGGATLDYYVYESVITNVVAGNITYTTKKFD